MIISIINSFKFYLKISLIKLKSDPTLNEILFFDNQQSLRHWMLRAILTSIKPNSFDRYIAWFLQCCFSLSFRVLNISSISCSSNEYVDRNSTLHSRYI